MRINEIDAIKREGGWTRVSSSVGPGELWFDLPENIPVPKTCGDSFAVMALAPSMYEGTPLVIDGSLSISSTLIENLHRAQIILHSYNPEFRLIDIRANESWDRPSGHEGLGTSALFSGGVDSIFNVARRSDEIDSAIFIMGFDGSLRTESNFRSSIQRNIEILEKFGVALYPVRTNQLDWGEKTGVARTFHHGAYLAAAGLLLEPDRLLIPSTNIYRTLTASGCHPLLDPLWSNARTRVEHVDLDVSRSLKIMKIAEHEDEMQSLRVCWLNHDVNCGKCGKCLRTMITCQILGLQGPFQREASLSDIRNLRIRTTLDAEFTYENLKLAEARGERQIEKALKAALRRYFRRKSLLAIDQGFLFGALHRVRRKIRPRYDLADIMTWRV